MDTQQRYGHAAWTLVLGSTHALYVYIQMSRALYMFTYMHEDVHENGQYIKQLKSDVFKLYYSTHPGLPTEL
jgi:hypothetical protein